MKVVSDYKLLPQEVHYNVGHRDTNHIDQIHKVICHISD